MSGQAYDRTDGVLPGSRLEWFVTGPEFPTETSVGKGTSLLVSPPGGDWAPGTYEVRLEATDFEGAKSSTSTTVDVLEDAGLVRSRREGRYKFHDLDTGPLARIADRWLEPGRSEAR